MMRHVRLRTLLVARWSCSGAVARKGAADEFLGERVTVGWYGGWAALIYEHVSFVLDDRSPSKPASARA